MLFWSNAMLYSGACNTLKHLGVMYNMHCAAFVGKSHSYNAMLQVNCKAQQMVPKIVHARLTRKGKPCSRGTVTCSV